MGQNNSLPKQRRLSLRSPFPRRRRIPSQSQLSHTFTLYNDNLIPELMNINFATEEELMTLPGINRAVARSIVEHRKAIGRFKRVEDLALVRGIGAEKLEQIRPEICVFRSCNSSRAPSVDSLRSTDLNMRLTRVVNVNKGNVFELQCVRGVTQEMAAAIVHYRNKKGPFKQLDDLIKVKNIDAVRLSNIRQHLTTTDTDCESTISYHNQTNGSVKNGINGSTPIVTRHKRTFSGPTKIHATNGLVPSTLYDIHELLSAYSSRPFIEDNFTYKRNNKSAVRISTWNLHQLSVEKAQNLGVKEVICRTILENKWSIIAVQEVVETEALKVICEELNSPKLHQVSTWKENSRCWNFCMFGSNLGFIYDTDSGGLGVEVQTLRDASMDDIEAIVCEFLIEDLKLILLNIQLPPNLPIELVNEKIRESISQTDSLMILGDFQDITINRRTSIHKHLETNHDNWHRVHNHNNRTNHKSNNNHQTIITHVNQNNEVTCQEVISEINQLQQDNHMQSNQKVSHQHVKHYHSNHNGLNHTHKELKDKLHINDDKPRDQNLETLEHSTSDIETLRDRLNISSTTTSSGRKLSTGVPLGILKEIGGLQAILPLNTNTACPDVPSRYADNILVTQTTQAKLTGVWGVVKKGLTHLAIPNGWTWGGPVSPHCPLWVEIFTAPVNGTIL